jgi:large subunit ribosomal protein L21
MLLYRGGNICYHHQDMKKAVIITGGKQYIVTEGEMLNVELIKVEDKTVSFEPILVIDGEKIQVGSPTVSKVTVTAEVLESDVQTDKVTSIRYKAKKRVHTIRGHRQHNTVLKITKIA